MKDERGVSELARVKNRVLTSHLLEIVTGSGMKGFFEC